jgi:hypothetical protein
MTTVDSRELEFLMTMLLKIWWRSLLSTLSNSESSTYPQALSLPQRYIDNEETNLASNVSIYAYSGVACFNTDDVTRGYIFTLVEVTRPQSTYVVHPTRDLRLWTRNLPFTWGATIAWWVVRIVPSIICEGKELSARHTIVVVPSCIPFAVRASGDELCAWSTALKAFGWLLWRWGRVYSFKSW